VRSMARTTRSGLSRVESEEERFMDPPDSKKGKRKRTADMGALASEAQTKEAKTVASPAKKTSPAKKITPVKKASPAKRKASPARQRVPEAASTGRRKAHPLAMTQEVEEEEGEESELKILNKRWVATGSNSTVYREEFLVSEGAGQKWVGPANVPEEEQENFHCLHPSLRVMPAKSQNSGCKYSNTKRVVKYTRLPRYTPAEDAALIKYVAEHTGKTVDVVSGRYQHIQTFTLSATGNMLWKQAEKDNVTGNIRSWDSMRDRYMKYLRERQE